MDANYLPIELPGCHPGIGTYAARIRRFDGMIYDRSDKTFKTVAVDPLIPLVAGTGYDQTVRKAFVPIDKKVWKDGDYTVYCHDVVNHSHLVVAETQIQVWDGSWLTIRPASPTETALRVFSVTTTSRTTAGTFGGDHLLMMRQLNYICQYVQKATGLPAPK